MAVIFYKWCKLILDEFTVKVWQIGQKIILMDVFTNLDSLILYYYPTFILACYAHLSILCPGVKISTFLSIQPKNLSWKLRLISLMWNPFLKNDVFALKVLQCKRKWKFWKTFFDINWCLIFLAQRPFLNTFKLALWSIMPRVATELKSSTSLLTLIIRAFFDPSA